MNKSSLTVVRMGCLINKKMKVYKTTSGIVVRKNNKFYKLNEDNWMNS